MLKRIVIAAVVALAYAGGSLVVLDLASATEQERITIGEGEKVVREYPPIPGNDPAGEFIHPDACNTASAVCDVIPFTVLPPADEGSEFLFRINVHWEAEDDPSGMTSLQSDDLDLYIWTDPPGETTHTATPDNPDDSDNPGASGRNPERLNLFLTEPGDFLLVVSNFLGVNEGYRVEAEYFSGTLVKPFESLDPEFTPPVDRSGRPPSAASAPVPAARSAGPPSGSAPAPTATTLPPGDAAGDAAFDDIVGVDDEVLTASPPTVPLRTREISAPEDVSGLVLVLWFVVVPGVVLAVGGWVFVRRQGAAVRVTPPATGTAS